MTEWLTQVLDLPENALRGLGTIAVGAILGLGTYVAARIKEARRPLEPAVGLPRIALDPVDRDLGFTLVRTGTDLTRALHDHGEILRATLAPMLPPAPVPPPIPPAPHPTRRTRTRP